MKIDLDKYRNNLPAFVDLMLAEGKKLNPWQKDLLLTLQSCPERVVLVWRRKIGYTFIERKKDYENFKLICSRSRNPLCTL